ncbi:MAG: lactate utilization protein [Aromatoleum sp.]|jgi:L-lactate dehydrogenase complex protein LldG|uniref:LutC/YkgG family protein n=1 Tax=Aromatoleum sp. TaxID=2307007 RepID=UPI0028951CEC|nr:lactate utilization protein [Aromatoleum sp.]MDT3671994.1 lactate utilization protein [Aromatoleum sp.]
MSTSENARDAILRSVRSALRRDALDGAEVAALDARVPAHTRPAHEEDLVARFIRKFESRAGTVERVASRDAVPAAVEAYRAAHQLPERAAVGAGLKELTWPEGWLIHGEAAGITEALAVSPAFCGVAETGSVMLASGPDSPTTHNFVPDDHVVVLDTGRIVDHFEDAWTLLRARPQGMPRATNIVSGPSRTADIQQTIQLGAHGPRRMHVILVG